MRICEIPNCGKKHNGRGLCVTHYSVWKKYGDPLYVDNGCNLLEINQGRRNTLNDFWSKVNKTDNCWEWTGSRDNYGYGVFWWNNKQITAHRFILGVIEELCIVEKEVCHHCDNPPCVRPKHLFIGTALENKRDSVKKNRQTKGEDCHTAKLLEEQVIFILELLEEGYSRGKLANIMNVSKSCIDAIAVGKSWKHLR